MSRQAAVSIQGDNFYLNGRPTYEGRTYQEMRIEGLLLNSRMVQGIFDDLNPETRAIWDYPDGPWDPQRNTDEFVAAMSLWRDHGLLAFTLNLQGGSPWGYTQLSKGQSWHNSAFDAKGDLRSDYMHRLERILDQADALGMVAIVGFFYHGQDQHLTDEEAIVHACDQATGWLLEKGYTNILVEICNQADVGHLHVEHLHYHHSILTETRVHELIQRAQQCSQGDLGNSIGRLLVSTSFCSMVTEPVAACADFLLLHGNDLHDPDAVRQSVDRCRALAAYRDQPIVFNEDDHTDFAAPDNNMLAAIGTHASWGFFDYRQEGEEQGAGYQSIPVNWGINTRRKRDFFGLVRRVTGVG